MLSRMFDSPVSEHMQPTPAVVSPETTVGELATLFAEQGIGFAAVMDGERLVGVVSESDLILQEMESDDLHLPHAIPFLGDLVFIQGNRRFEERFRKSFGTTVDDLMDRDPVAVRPDDTLHAAARKIVEHDVSRLPVLDESGRLVGSVGRSEIVKALAEVEFRPDPSAPPLA